MSTDGLQPRGRRAEPARKSPIDHRANYRRTHELGAPFIRAFCGRFALAGKRIVSIGSGTCAEEAVMAQCGASIDCVDPIAHQLEIGREMAARAGLADAVHVHACRHQDFQSADRYDAIYISGAQDWMDTDFRDLVPAAYLDFFRRHGAARSVLAIRFWSNEHSPDVLGSTWFPKALAERFRAASDYRLREYWLSDNAGHALAIATQGIADLTPDTGFADCATRFGEASTCRFRCGVDAVVTPSARERLTPPLLAARHRIRRLRAWLRRRPRRDRSL